MKIELVVPGEPQGKLRAKAVRIGPHVSTYTPDKTVKFETYIRELFAVKYPDFVPMEGALILKFIAWISIPKSTSKKKKILMQKGVLRPTKKPDIDNIEKLILDALQSLAFKTDSQVVAVLSFKYCSERPRLEIKIEEAKFDEWIRNRLDKIDPFTS